MLEKERETQTVYVFTCITSTLADRCCMYLATHLGNAVSIIIARSHRAQRHCNVLVVVVSVGSAALFNSFLS